MYHCLMFKIFGGADMHLYAQLFMNLGYLIHGSPLAYEHFLHGVLSSTSIPQLTEVDNDEESPKRNGKSPPPFSI